MNSKNKYKNDFQPQGLTLPCLLPTPSHSLVENQSYLCRGSLFARSKASFTLLSKKGILSPPDQVHSFVNNSGEGRRGGQHTNIVIVDKKNENNSNNLITSK